MHFLVVDLENTKYKRIILRRVHEFYLHIVCSKSSFEMLSSTQNLAFQFVVSLFYEAAARSNTQNMQRKCEKTYFS